MSKTPSVITTSYNKEKLKKLISDKWLTRKELSEEMFLTPTQVTRVIAAVRYFGTPIITRKIRVEGLTVSQYKLASSDDISVLRHKDGRSNNRENLIMIAVLSRIINMCVEKKPHEDIQKQANLALQSCGVEKELNDF
ncbi:MAG: hypothetical protein Unbinned97contig1000_37 [Prokaryotic dsDNA virus sp.]|nr:MAG: hypothetical protein Unbinned97contig1000_37 [Prokaryotic dsDNA virus sp.]|tara:strand:+ start:541 stop:954 length:414 start_codon:yes stop_codon:yes gene_type:complete